MVKSESAAGSRARELILERSFKAEIAKSGIKRKIDARAKRALVKLANTIEYLADEYVVSEGWSEADEGGVLDAIDLLLRTNRAVFMECPAAPFGGEGLAHYFHRFFLAQKVPPRG